MITASQLDRRIEIQANTETRGGCGGVIKGWTTVATIWAQFLAGGGNEKFISAQVYAETQARFRIRWRDDISSDNRILFDGKEWDVLAVDEIGRRVGLELKVKARAL